MPNPGFSPERFWGRVDKSGDCWLWLGALNRDGYGHTSRNNKTVFTHRLAYELEVGPIPEGFVLDHLCRVHNCVRPDHLEPVTAKENVDRGERSSTKTECIHGHPYEPDNLYRNPAGKRICRVCMRANSRRRYAEKRSERDEGAA